MDDLWLPIGLFVGIFAIIGVCIWLINLRDEERISKITFRLIIWSITLVVLLALFIAVGSLTDFDGTVMCLMLALFLGTLGVIYGLAKIVDYFQNK